MRNRLIATMVVTLVGACTQIGPDGKLFFTALGRTPHTYIESEHDGVIAVIRMQGSEDPSPDKIVDDRYSGHGRCLIQDRQPGPVAGSDRIIYKCNLGNEQEDYSGPLTHEDCLKPRESVYSSCPYTKYENKDLESKTVAGILQLEKLADRGDAASQLYLATSFSVADFTSFPGVVKDCRKAKHYLEMFKKNRHATSDAIIFGNLSLQTGCPDNSP